MKDFDKIDILTKQLNKNLLEIEEKDKIIQKLSEENAKLKQGSSLSKTSSDGIYMVRRKKGNVVYGFTIYDEKKRKIKKEGFKTKTEAAIERRKLLSLRDNGKLSVYSKNQKYTFKDLADTYLEKANSEFAINTQEAAKGIIKNHLGTFANKKIIDITEQFVQDWANSYRYEIRPCAFNNSLKLAKSIWNNAINKNMISLTNPFNGIHNINIKKEYEIRTPVRINKKQAKSLVQTAKNLFKDYTFCVIALGIYAGLREGECLGLKWEDIDFKEKTIKIQRQVQKVTKKKLKELLKKFPEQTEEKIIITSRLKTESSRATIAVPDLLLTYLNEYRELLMMEGNIHELCFCKKDGKALVARDFVRYRFQKVLKSVFGDEKYMHFHELRGSCASILHSERVPTKIIQNLLRHEKMSVTEDIYIHADKTSQDVKDALNSVFNN